MFGPAVTAKATLTPTAGAPLFNTVTVTVWFVPSALIVDGGSIEQPISLQSTCDVHENGSALIAPDAVMTSVPPVPLLV